MFSKEERSSFSYWFAHWCAYQMTALNAHAWKFHYLFHDWEKPWLKLFMPYPNVKKWHRMHNRHHIERYIEMFNNCEDVTKFDWQGMAIDWECSRFTKSAQPLNAFQTAVKELSKMTEQKLGVEVTEVYWKNIINAIKELNFDAK